MSFDSEKGHYQCQLDCNLDQSEVTNASDKLPARGGDCKTVSRVCTNFFFVLSVQSHIVVRLTFFYKSR